MPSNTNKHIHNKKPPNHNNTTATDLPDTIHLYHDSACFTAMGNYEDARRDGLVRFGMPLSVYLTGARQMHAEGFDGSGVKVAVVDTCVDHTHPALRRGTGSGPKVKQVQLTQAATSKPNDHGTAVAALIAGYCDDSVQPYIGVAPGAEIVSYSVFSVDSEGQSVADESIIARAIEHATTKEKVDIINLSLGTRAVNHSYKMPILHEAIKKATKAGVLVVCAAGNSNNSGIVYPAAFEECISVGNVAYDIQTGQISRVQQQSLIDCCAVGKDVVVAIAGGERGGGYAIGEGTSFSAPIVSGVAALKIHRARVLHGKTAHLSMHKKRLMVLSDTLDAKMGDNAPTTSENNNHNNDGFGIVTLFKSWQ